MKARMAPETVYEQASSYPEYQSVHAPAFAAQRQKPRNVPPLPSDRCCICGAGLNRGYGSLFTNVDGEARADENCCNGISILAHGTDKSAVMPAYNYFASRLGQVHPAVADYLRYFLRAAEKSMR